jgi:hypothetical protein
MKTGKLLSTNLPSLSKSSYYSNPPIKLYPQKLKRSYVEEPKECPLLHSKHALTLFLFLFWNRAYVLPNTLFGLKIPSQEVFSSVRFEYLMSTQSLLFQVIP